MTDFDFDLDALLDDIAAEVSDLTSESLLDRHDRLRLAFITAQERLTQAKAKKENTERSVSVNAGLGDNWAPWRRFVTPQFTDKNGGAWRMDASLVVPRLIKGERDMLVEAITESHVDLLITAWNDVQRAEDEYADAERTYREVYDEVQDTKAFTEGCYVRFEGANFDSWGYCTSTFRGYGVITKITASGYIVQIDQHASHHRFGGKETLRIKYDNATDSAESKGRGLSIEWGPTGNAQRAERERLAALEREAEARRNQQAYERCQAACAAYDAAKRADNEHQHAVATAPERAAVEATRRILAKYADEVQAEADAVLAVLLSEIPAYERPEILDNPPSREWSDYLEEM